MTNGKTNVERLVDAGVITDVNLTDAGKTQLNTPALSDAEIAQLQSIQKKFGLAPLDPTKPGTTILQL
jgi:hypothetical protein